MSSLLVPRSGGPLSRPTETSTSYRISGSGTNDRAQRRGIYPNFPSPLSKIQRQLTSLGSWPEGWDGYEAAKPNRDSIKNADNWIRTLYRGVTHALWIEPNIVADAEGDVVFEWWHNEKKLTVYVSPEIIEYIKVEGPDIHADMYDGTAETAKDSRMLWHWLLRR